MCNLYNNPYKSQSTEPMMWNELALQVCISPDLAPPPPFAMECHPTSIIFCDCLPVELN